MMTHRIRPLPRRMLGMLALPLLAVLFTGQCIAQEAFGQSTQPSQSAQPSQPLQATQPSQLAQLSQASQPAYFIDGYHGGIYGHLPVWQTKFMVEKLAQYPDWKINLEIEPESWDTIALQDPVSYKAFQRLFADQSSNGRIEYVNPAYAQSYLYNISGESVIRQFYYGMKKLRRHFPSAVFTTYSSEEPCFTSALPQILQSYGFKYASLKNPNTCWGGYTRAFGGELVNWIGPDGSSILTIPRYEVEALKPRSIWETIASNNNRGYVRSAFRYGIVHPVGMCLQDAGWAFGPWLRGAGSDTSASASASAGASASAKASSGQSLFANAGVPPDSKASPDANKDSQKVYAPTIYETWRGYVENISTRKADKDWRFSQEDVLVGLMWGSQVLQHIAREVRTSENAIISAEKMAAFARVWQGSPWPQDIFEAAWRTLLLSQHHDCWIVPYNGKPGDTWADKVVTWTDYTNACSDSITGAALRELAGGNPVSRERAGTNDVSHQLSGTAGVHPSGVIATNTAAHFVRVFNTTAVRRKEYVRMALPPGWEAAAVSDLRGRNVPGQSLSSREILFEANVPSMGYSTYHLQRGKGETGHTIAPATSSASVIHQPNGQYQVETDLYRIVVDPAKGGTITSWVAKQLGGKEFVEEGKNFNELRGNFYNAGGFRSSTEVPAEIRVLEKGPAEVKLEIKGTIAGSPFAQVLTLQEGRPRVDVHLVIDWKDNPAIGEYFEVPKNEQVRKAYYDDRYKLLALFPLSMASRKVYKNAPFDVTESKLSNTFYNRWDSIKNNVLLNWVDVEDSAGHYGMALFCDHTTSYVHGEDFPLALTLQYSGNGIFYRDYKINGPSEMNYAWVPHAGKWDRAGIWAEGTKWNAPLLTRMTDKDADEATGPVTDKVTGHATDKVTGHATNKATASERRKLQAAQIGERSLVQLEQAGMEISSLTFEGDDLIVRLFNAEAPGSSQKLYLGFAADSAAEVALNGQWIKGLPIRQDGSGRRYVELTIPRFGIRTLRFGFIRIK